MSKSTPVHRRSLIIRLGAILGILAVILLPARVSASGGTGIQVTNYSGLTSSQQTTLMSIAKDTWTFYKVDVDPNTHLPMDNVTFAGGSPAPTGYGKYTSASNIGVYLWAVVAANDLGLISRPDARAEIEATLNEVSRLKRYDGFLYQWYDTTNGDVIKNPGDIDCSAETTPTTDNCYFISQVDNGWYSTGLIEVRQAMPELRSLVDSLMAPMNFGIFYDNGPENQCNVNPANGDPTGQMYGGYYVGVGPAGYHNGALYSDPRISAYIGMGLHQMPGNVWWRTWRILPPQQCSTDPDFSWTGQGPGTGYWQKYTDPQSSQVFNVWEGHYTYPGTDLHYVPTWGGGMFEALMANEVVPETSWGPRSFGLNDVLNAEVQIKYATDQLHYPVWGLSPSSTPDDTGNYNTYGAEGLVWPYALKQGLSQCYGCATEDTVTPHASFLALDVLPQQAFANIQALRTLYPGIYGPHGFYDAVNPVTRTVGHRDLVLDQSMIMAALDNALNNRAMQRHFARDQVSWAAQTYLSMETMSLTSQP